MDLAALATADGFDELGALLRGWVPRQRWFAGKARDFADLRLHDAILLTAADEADVVLDVIVDVSYDDGHVERYQVPLAGVTDQSRSAANPADAVGRIGDLHLLEATAVASGARVLAGLAVDSAQRRTARGDILTGQPLGDEQPQLQRPRRLSAEQSNTSVVLGDAVILKVFRRLEPGENPDVEITRALTESGYGNAPRQRGAVSLHHADGSVTALGVLADFVKNGREGWALATADVAAGHDEFITLVHDLGSAVADMHGALARALGRREATADDLNGWVDEMLAQINAVLETAQRRATEQTAAVLRRRKELLARVHRLADEKATGPLTRIHGDLHLGQVLLDREGRWQLLDFEGEPAKPLQQRRALNAPLRDVAGMLRSLDYAAASGTGGDLGDVPPSAAVWRDAAREAFLRGYLAEAATYDVLPDHVDAQLDAFELDKGVYELGYELANRPDWVPIPVGGICRVLDRTKGEFS